MTYPTHKATIVFAGLLTALLGILLFWLIYTQWIHPAPFYSNYDPEMPYFFSSLAYIKGAPLVYIDHPGTPIEIWGALVFWLTYPLAWWSNIPFFDFHIQYPEVFLVIVRTFVTLLNLISVVVLAVCFWRRRDTVYGLLAVSLAALYFALHSYSFEIMTIWSHNAFNFSLGTMILVGLYIVLRKDRPVPTRDLILLGAAASFFSTITIQLATWVIGICLAFFLFRLFRKEGVGKAVADAIIVGVSSLITFILVTLPIASQYSSFLKWVYGLIIHQDRYGYGEVSIVPPALLVERLMLMLQDLPLLALGIVLASILIIVVLWQGRKTSTKNNGLRAYIIAVFIQLVLMLMIVAKHPGGIYMLAATAILPPLIGASLVALEDWKPFKIISIALSLSILIALSYNSISSFKRHNDHKGLIINSQRSIEAYLQDFSQKSGKPREKLVVLWTYGVYNTCNALWFGNDYGAGALSVNIHKICPNDAGLNIFTGYVNTGVQYVSLAESKWDVIVFRESLFQSALSRLVFAKDYDIVESDIEPPISSYRSIIFLVTP